MIVHRWQAKIIPSKTQIQKIFEADDLQAKEDIVEPTTTKPQEIKNPYTEMRVVVSGALFVEIIGNKLLLRPGDKIIIPSNTKHTKTTQGDAPCVSLVAYQF
ncbi:MAG: cupin domain-containing protein [Bdellovibrionaceae bacterium]|nr:cupin domain-containing protein [Pseudobdellovibrionaceae bacterium]